MAAASGVASGSGRMESLMSPASGATSASEAVSGVVSVRVSVAGPSGPASGTAASEPSVAISVAGSRGTIMSSIPMVPTITDRSPFASDGSATKLQWRNFSRVSASGWMLARSAGFSLIDGWPDTVRMVARSASIRSAKLSGCSAMARPARALARRRMASLIEVARASLSTAVSSDSRAVAASKA